MKDKEITEIMRKEHKNQTKEMLKSLEKIGATNPMSLYQDIVPEKEWVYDPNKSEENAYRELARLDWSYFGIPYRLHEEYTKSLIPMYEGLIPFIKDDWHDWINQQIRFAKERLDTFKEFKTPEWKQKVKKDFINLVLSD